MWTYPQLRPLLLALTGSLLMLGVLTALHATLDWPAVAAFDRGWQQTLHAHASPALTVAMLTLTWIGAIKIFLPATTLGVGLLAARGHRRDAAILAGAIFGALILNETLKLHFHRLRPELPWSIGDEHTFSFPSGHSFFAVLLYGILAWLAARKGLRWPVVPAVLMPLAIGLSRIYLGMHYPTDVLGGYLAGLIWLATVVLIAGKGEGTAKATSAAQPAGASPYVPSSSARRSSAPPRPA